MSNVLTPIVERYSLFFTLAMFSSSNISRSKQPTHLVQTLLLEAQQRYQDNPLSPRVIILVYIHLPH
ncbi:hypothetical protein BGZ96_007711 [Linnemannia gamsii]|uniref:Uncharacterized protein n=1 Tax=Linnemannia gamsii TaxID=64522 RepID=A0ABQ7JZT4_9FUNG|nr:hypothetical protein BGZ96_007711 [Linnemannia gamsii]